MKPKIDNLHAEYSQIEELEATDPDKALERYEELRDRVDNLIHKAESD